VRSGRVIQGVMLRRLVLALGLALVPLAAQADPTSQPAAPDQVRNGGMITGRITAIDYQRSTLGVDAGSRGRLVVAVMPSTSIQGRDTAYHTFSDLKTGEHVQIMSSVAGGTYVAQIIRLR
jgi:hypothetical protein